MCTQLVQKTERNNLSVNFPTGATQGDKRRSEMSKNVKETIIESLEQLTVIELVDLVKELEDKWGVSAAAAAAPAAVAAPAADAQQEEQTEFDVVLTEIGSQKIQVIKVVRAITSLGLKEAKALVDGAPNNVKEGVTKEEAEEIKTKLADVGATVEIK